MKIFYFLALTTLLFSCKNQDNKDKLDKLNTIKFSTEKFVGSTVAYQENNKIKLGITNKELLNSFNNYSAKLKLDFKADSSQIKKIDGKNYIRFFNENGSVSTVALLNVPKSKNSKIKLLYIGKTTCTTTDCAYCCGCLPNGDYCTPCDLNSNDCIRTTSN